MFSVPKDILNSLINLAETRTYFETENSDTVADIGDSHDIYTRGVEDGEVQSARQFLAKMGIDFNIRKED